MLLKEYARHLSFALLLLVAAQVRAEPYLAVQNGFKCGQCHVNPTGGGERTAFGNAFAQTQLPAKRLDTGPDLWTGEVNRFLSVGGDLRTQFAYTQISRTPSTNEFDFEQLRLYGTANIIPQRLYLYVDEQVAPGGAVNQEAYGVYWSANHDWYVKAGQMYLPFGFRLQDLTAFVQDITEINMAAPDRGVELGFERGHWDAQLAITNGAPGGPENNRGKEYTAQLVYVEPVWRAGAALSRNSLSTGHRDAAGLFAGLRTGPLAWLAQVDLTNDDSVGPTELRQAAALLEGDWRIRQGHNLKVTLEYENADRNVARAGLNKWSVVYELTPFQFVQIRPGIRYFNGVPGAPLAHETLAFIELHGFF